MDKESDQFTTPKQTKRLGLRRSTSVVKSNSFLQLKESGAKSKAMATESSPSTPNSRLVQSDVKVNYKHLRLNDINPSDVNSISTPATPKNAGISDLQRLVVSTNCRPYRLALSKRVREKMTKKRLDFFLANEMEKECREDEQTKEEQRKCNTTKKQFTSRQELLEQIEIARKELTARQEHLDKVKELQEVISVWKNGFSATLHDLQNKLEPRMDFATLLQHLHIPHEMLKYIND